MTIRTVIQWLKTVGLLCLINTSSCVGYTEDNIITFINNSGYPITVRQPLSVADMVVDMIEDDDAHLYAVNKVVPLHTTFSFTNNGEQISFNIGTRSFVVGIFLSETLTVSRSPVGDNIKVIDQHDHIILSKPLFG